MKIGLQIPSFTWPGGDRQISAHLADIAQAADQAGFASIWVMDHFFQIPNVGQVDEPMLECYTTLGYLAAHTRRVRLGALVTGVIYRNPGILVKSVTTLDVLSSGRANFGIGAAWNEHESRSLGVAFPPVAERFERLEETLQIAVQMWSGKRAPFDGKHYHLAETINQPQPVTRPHPPILIGGRGEKKTLRLVARYGDACNLFAGEGLEVLRHKLEVLKRHCEEVGRPYEQIEKTTLEAIRLGKDGISASELIEKCRILSELGFQQAIISLKNVSEIQPLETIGKEVIPAVSAF